MQYGTESPPSYICDGGRKYWRKNRGHGNRYFLRVTPLGALIKLIRSR